MVGSQAEIDESVGGLQSIVEPAPGGAGGAVINWRVQRLAEVGGRGAGALREDVRARPAAFLALVVGGSADASCNSGVIHSPVNTSDTSDTSDTPSVLGILDNHFFWHISSSLQQLLLGSL